MPLLVRQVLLQFLILKVMVFPLPHDSAEKKCYGGLYLILLITIDLCDEVQLALRLPQLERSISQNNAALRFLFKQIYFLKFLKEQDGEITHPSGAFAKYGPHLSRRKIERKHSLNFCTCGKMFDPYDD